MESYFLESGLSWTMSKAVPYIIMVFVGLLILLVVKRFLKSINKYLKWVLLLIIFAVPFGIYFMLHPIYQGDFSNNVVQVEKIEEFNELEGEKLVVITIPGCKYCYEAVDDLLVMKSRLKNISIEYIVCSTDSSTVNWYKEKTGTQIDVRIAQNPEALMRLADYSFPTYILVDNNKPLKKWSNDSFGVFAKDEVELHFD
jgi:hypothetical protein